MVKRLQFFCLNRFVPFEFQSSSMINDQRSIDYTHISLMIIVVVECLFLNYILPKLSIITSYLSEKNE